MSPFLADASAGDAGREGQYSHSVVSRCGVTSGACRS